MAGMARGRYRVPWVRFHAPSRPRGTVPPFDLAIDCTGPEGGVPAGVDLLLLPGRAAFIPTSGTLLVADLHLGKAATFRRAGIPIPEGSAAGDLERLAALVGAHGVRRVLILGDLLHAAAGCTPAVVGQFRAVRDRLAGTEFILVLGNHDRPIRRFAADLGLDACLPSLVEPPFRFVHDAGGEAGENAFVVAGHVHPRIVLRGPAGACLAERCFHRRPLGLTLPAFGSFTGGQEIIPGDGDRLWVARDDGVVEVTRLARGSRR